MTQAIAKRSKAAQLTEFLKDKKNEIAKILPSTSIEHVTKTALMAVMEKPDIMEKCAIPSIYRSVMQAGLMGLTVGGNDGYLVRYGNTCTFKASYVGWSKVARRSEYVDVIRASIVYSNDTLDMSEQPPTVRHVPSRGDRGKLEGAVAVAYTLDGQNHILFDFTFVSAEELTEARHQAGKSPAWDKWPDEMRKKVAIRRLCKMLPSNDALERLIRIENDADNGIVNIPDPAIPSDIEQIEQPVEPKLGEIVDAEFVVDEPLKEEKPEVVTETKPKPEPKEEKTKAVESPKKSAVNELKTKIEKTKKKEEKQEEKQEETPDYGISDQEDLEF